ncbi:glutamate-cysteine ligase family protein [Catellatospora sp. KI3]|uniref:glutamate-cysteine ligase family protein n=1 Tax=Catellatospora sp. KI3 TaxID=3041620 RepID=UPI00248322BE|nr:glutamate-cysteine ligase family protein [Catellatospora sp. KI3]MDI1462072.1 glutamate-cysteine ligase family protein [Catellatospora sp. KI3]
MQVRQETLAAGAPVVTDRAQAEGYVAKVCFKTGPPRGTGVELEWTVHHRDDPARAVDAQTLARALGEHAPRTLVADSPQSPLGCGGAVTLEPGGQVEISSAPSDSLAALLADTAADQRELAGLLGRAGLVLAGRGCDEHRAGQRILDTPRYAAMEAVFDRFGPYGRMWMCGTASVQVCLDAGLPGRAGPRWHALHAIGPVLVAAFANSSRQAGVDTGWASARLRACLAADPARNGPPAGLDGHAGTEQELIAAWARRVLDTPVLCVRRPAGPWAAPPGLTFADWIAGALTPPPTLDDLDYHLSTVFPPVRARGYYEVRYLDMQSDGDGSGADTAWTVPVAVVAALFTREETVDAAAELAAPAAGRWVQAARHGLADPAIAAAAPRLLDLARAALDGTDLPPDTVRAVRDAVDRRLRQGGIR